MDLDFSGSSRREAQAFSDWRTAVVPPLEDRRTGATLPVPYLTLPVFLRIAIGLAALPLLIDGLVPQIEMAYFGGNIPIRINYYLLMGLLALWALLQGKFYSSELANPALIVGTYLLLDFGHLIFNEGIPPGEAFRASLVAFSLLIFAALALSLRIGISEKFMVSLMLVMLVANLVVQVMQFTTNSPVLPEQSRDMTWQVDTDVFINGTQRAFGLFSNGLDAGVFCAFTGTLGAAYCRKFSNLPFGLSILAMSAFGCYASMTRVPMIALGLGIISVILLRPRFRRFPLRILPFLWGGVSLITLGIAILSPSRGRGLDSSTSTMARMQCWFVSLQTFASSSTMEKFFGSGIASGLHVSAGKDLTKFLPFSIDNMFLAQLLYFGLLCLIPSLYLVWRAWGFLYNRARADATPFRIAGAAFGSTIFFLGMYNNGSNIWGAVLLISALCTGVPTRAAASSPAVSGVSSISEPHRAARGY